MKERYYSLDVFRGATVALMILVNNQGSPTYAPLDHAPWNGCTPTDLVFPFFLFAVGNAMSFVIPRFREKGTSYFLQKVIKRTLLIFLIGLLLNWSPFLFYSHDHITFKPWEWIADDGNAAGVRVLGVLQRIALCYFLASLIVYFFKPKAAFIICAFLLFIYWWLCFSFGDPADPYSLKGYFGTNIDKATLGDLHMYHGEGVAFDPEGWMGTLSATVQVVFGYFVGQYIQQKGKNYEMLSNLFIAAVVLLFTGYCWDMVFPVNKKIWTSSYTIYTTGLAIIVLCTLIFLIEFKNRKGAWSRFFDVFGKNPLFIFVLSGFIPRILSLIRINDGTDEHGQPKYISPLYWLYEHAFKDHFYDQRLGSVLYAVSLITVYWLIVYVLDKRKIYIRV